MENKWKLEGIPAYSGGELNPTLFNCGSGMKDDFTGPTDEDSFMHIVTKTTKEEFCAYCGVLEADGYRKIYENETEAGLFVEFKGEKHLYVYYIFNEADAHADIRATGTNTCFIRVEIEMTTSKTIIYC